MKLIVLNSLVINEIDNLRWLIELRRVKLLRTAHQNLDILGRYNIATPLIGVVSDEVSLATIGAELLDVFQALGLSSAVLAIWKSRIRANRFKWVFFDGFVFGCGLRIPTAYLPPLVHGRMLVDAFDTHVWGTDLGALLRYEMPILKETVHHTLVLIVLYICLNVFEHLLKPPKNIFLSTLLIQSALKILDLLFLVIDDFLHLNHFGLLFVTFCLKVNGMSDCNASCRLIEAAWLFQLSIANCVLLWDFLEIIWVRCRGFIMITRISFDRLVAILWFAL